MGSARRQGSDLRFDSPKHNFVETDVVTTIRGVSTKVIGDGDDDVVLGRMAMTAFGAVRATTVLWGLAGGSFSTAVWPTPTRCRAAMPTTHCRAGWAMTA